jgi:hypothetical protein
MEYEEDISSSEDEFNFSSVTNEIISKHRLLVHGEEEGSDEDSDEDKGVGRRKIRIIDSESEREYDCAEEIEPSEWTMCTESEDFRQKRPRASTS